MTAVVVLELILIRLPLLINLSDGQSHGTGYLQVIVEAPVPWKFAEKSLRITNASKCHGWNQTPATKQPAFHT